MDGKKPSKLRDIKETASDAVKIMRQIGTPGVFQSFSKIKETATIANEMIQVGTRSSASVVLTEEVDVELTHCFIIETADDSILVPHPAGRIIFLRR